jgi:hypothetical protein
MNSILTTLLNPKYRSFILLVIVVVLSCLLISECNGRRKDAAQAKLQSELSAQNDSAKNAKIVNVLNKAGELEATKQSFVTSLAALKKQNDSLYLESKKEIGTLRAIIQTQGQVSTAPVFISDSLKKYDAETYGLTFSKNHLDSTLQWSISGVSTFKLLNNVITPGQTEIISNKMTIPLILGFTESGTDYKVFARSSSPDVTFSQLNGALIIPKAGDIVCPPVPAPKRWGIGPLLGVGIALPFTPSVFVGVGVQYNIIRF